jgi:hypothetical protein
MRSKVKQLKEKISCLTGSPQRADGSKREFVLSLSKHNLSLAMGGRVLSSGMSLATHNARHMTERKRGLMMEQSGSMKPTTILLSMGAPGGRRERRAVLKKAPRLITNKREGNITHLLCLAE